MTDAHGEVLAVSDLHVNHAANRAVVDRLLPRSSSDWLIVAGDVAEHAVDVMRTLTMLRGRFAKVIWAPGNHDLWTVRNDGLQLRGEARYRHLVDLCREAGVVTPEDPYPVWTGPGGPIVLAPMFLLYDYSFGPRGGGTPEQNLQRAVEAGVVCSDEFFLHADPYPSRAAWCRARVAATARRLEIASARTRTMLINHFPLVRAPTRVLRHPEFALWCGTETTADWHLRFNAAVVVYGHLHIPRTMWHDGVRFEEVSLGYPGEWQRFGAPLDWPRRILPAPVVVP